MKKKKLLIGHSKQFKRRNELTWVTFELQKQKVKTRRGGFFFHETSPRVSVKLESYLRRVPGGNALYESHCSLWV